MTITLSQPLQFSNFKSSLMCLHSRNIHRNFCTTFTVKITHKWIHVLRKLPQPSQAQIFYHSANRDICMQHSFPNIGLFTCRQKNSLPHVKEQDLGQILINKNSKQFTIQKSRILLFNIHKSSFVSLVFVHFLQLKVSYQNSQGKCHVQSLLYSRVRILVGEKTKKREKCIQMPQ